MDPSEPCSAGTPAKVKRAFLGRPAQDCWVSFRCWLKQWATVGASPLLHRSCAVTCDLCRAIANHNATGYSNPVVLVRRDVVLTDVVACLASPHPWPHVIYFYSRIPDSHPLSWSSLRLGLPSAAAQKLRRSQNLPRTAAGPSHYPHQVSDLTAGQFAIYTNSGWAARYAVSAAFVPSSWGVIHWSWSSPRSSQRTRYSSCRS